MGVIKRVPATTPANNVFCYSAVAHIVTPLLNLAFRPKSGFKIKCRTRAGFRRVISGSGRVQASKWGPFTTLCGFVGRGQQAEIERTVHPPKTLGYANFRPNVFAAGKRISMEILVGGGACMMSSSIKKIWSFFKKTEMCKKNIYRLCNIRRLEQNIKSRGNPYFF